MSPLLRVLPICLLAFLVGSGQATFVPLIPQIVAEFDLTAVQSSMLFSAYALPGLALIPFSGLLQDRLGRRPVLLGCLGIAVLSTLFMAWVPSFAWLLFLRICQGVALPVANTLVDTLVTDNFRGEERVKYVVWTTSALFAGVLVFPLVSVPLTVHLGWRTAMLPGTALALPLYFAYLRIPMPYRPSKAVTFAAYAQTVRKLVTEWRVWSVFVFRMLFVGPVFGLTYAQIGAVVTDFHGFSTAIAGVVFCFFPVGNFVGLMLAPRLFGAIAPRRMGAVTGLLFLGGTILLATPGGEFVLCLGTFCHGFAYGTMLFMNPLALSSFATQDTRATLLACSSTLFRFSQLILPPFFGLCFQTGSFFGLFACSAVFSAGVLVLGPLVMGIVGKETLTGHTKA